MSKLGYSIFGKGPQRRKTYTKKVHGYRPTELHQDICNFGTTRKSAKLSDGEFALQVWEEFAFLLGKCCEHAVDAIGKIFSLLGKLFNMLGAVCDMLGKAFCN